MIHGRNAAPPNILDLVPRLDRPTFSYVAPAAANKTWYPFSFLEPIARNEPYLTSAINRLERHHDASVVEEPGSVNLTVAAAAVRRGRV